MRKKYRKHIHAGIIILIAVTVGAAILTFFYRYSQRSRATNKQVEFSLQSAKSVAKIGSELSLNINMVAQEPVSIATVLVEIPKDIIEFKAIEDCGTGFQSFQPTVIQGDDFDTVAITRYSMDSKDTLPTGAYCFGRMIFTAAANGEGTIRLTDPSQDVDNWKWEVAGPERTFEAESGSVSTVNISIGNISIPTPLPGVSLNLAPEKTPVKVNEEFDVAVSLQTEGKQVDGVRAIVRYDTSALQAVAVRDSDSFETYPQTVFDNSTGRVTIDAVSVQNVSGQDVLVGTVRFNALKEAATEIEILCTPPSSGGSFSSCDPNSDELSEVSEYKVEGEGILEEAGDATITIAGVLVSTPTPTLTQAPTTAPSPTPTVPGGPHDIEVELNIKLQGIISEPTNIDPLDAIVTLVDGQQEVIATKVVSFVPQSNGTWKGLVGYNGVSEGSTYLFLIKGPKHLQKKVCAGTPTEHIGGMYKCNEGSISLQNGRNVLDFTGIILLAGDLPPQQNGLIDAVDIAYIRSNMGRTESDIVARADLNYDKVVDSQEYGMIINALAFKYDEEE